ncbi:Shedu anti-phage system protein SduA domain-containing protein [Sorangium atrum]|uniref:DUF4263 domain-containing protein n=1 Tax=Sorangium atrum TaxID=2995308 RepID=A0ABT5BZW0_9BACT|nr:Shedu anti-phage system protein SduA domain-containing protein [Sorangium aterium]MDC0679697.1 DUF4263 domain-containing protein [Sorangium aterium]
MKQIPDVLQRNLTNHVIGRARLSLYRDITGQDGVFPDVAQIRNFIFGVHRKNAGLGTAFLDILNTRSIHVVSRADLVCTVDIDRLMEEIENHPLPTPLFLEVVSSIPEDEALGILIQRESLAAGGYIYSATGINDSFPRGLVFRIEVLASKNNQEPTFWILSEAGWTTEGRAGCAGSDVLQMVVCALSRLNENRGGREMQLIPLKEAVESDLDFRSRAGTEPPVDKTYDQFLRAVLRRQVRCSTLSIRLDLIRPHDYDFCLSYPLDVVEDAKKMILSGKRPELLVYWGGSRFVVSDDYCTYLAYRALGHSTVPVVALGKFPRSIGRPKRTGYSELLPDVGVIRAAAEHLPDPELKDYLIDRRLETSSEKSTDTTLWSLYLGLSRLVQNPRVKERQLHEFILNFPTVIEPFGARVLSEVWLGKKYRIDLAIQYELDEKRVLLIELERASLPLFTMYGRPRDHVTHAIQQVEDWIRWWRENPSDVPASFDSSFPVQGMVVIGRNAGMDSQTRRRLLHLNAGRAVKLITYDELLDRLQAMIGSIKSAQSKLGRS